MKYPDRRRIAEMMLDAVKDLFEIGKECRPIVSLRPMQGILAVIANIEDNDIEALGERQPEGRVGIGGETIAVAQSKPRSLPLAVAAQSNFRAVRHRKHGGLERLGQLEFREGLQHAL
jgi:hypothetical protein